MSILLLVHLISTHNILIVDYMLLCNFFHYNRKLKQDWENLDLGTDYYKNIVGERVHNRTGSTDFYKLPQGRLFVFREEFCRFLKSRKFGKFSEKFWLVRLLDYMKLFVLFRDRMTDDLKLRLEEILPSRLGQNGVYSARWVIDPVIVGVFSMWILANYNKGGISLKKLDGDKFHADDWESSDAYGAVQRSYSYEVVINPSKLLTQTEAIEVYRRLMKYSSTSQGSYCDILTQKELKDFVNGNGGLAALAEMSQVDRGKLTTKFIKDRYPTGTAYHRGFHQDHLDANLNKALDYYKSDSASAAKGSSMPSASVKEKVETAATERALNSAIAATSSGRYKAPHGTFMRDDLEEFVDATGGLASLAALRWSDISDLVRKFIDAKYPSSSQKQINKYRQELDTNLYVVLADYKRSKMLDPDANLYKEVSKTLAADTPTDTAVTTSAPVKGGSELAPEAGSGHGESMDSLVTPTQSSDLGDTLKLSPGFKPPLDPTMLGPMNKTNVVQPAEISLPNLEMAKQQGTSTETANVFEQYRKEQQEAADRQQKSLDKMNEMLNAMNPFFIQFGSVIDEKNGLRVAGIPELTAITAAKPVGGNTQIINNTIVQDQNDGLDLRKKQN